MNKYLLLLTLLTSSAIANEMPIASDQNANCEISSVEEGVRSAIKSISDIHYEWGGVVIKKPDGTLCVTNPVTSKSGYSVQYRMQMKKGTKIIAMYHTHPRSMDSHGTHFSKDDIEVSHNVNVPSYVYAYEDFTLRMYDPSKNKPGRRTKVALLGRL